MNDSFSTNDSLEVNGKKYRYASLARLGKQFKLEKLPYSMKILLENLLRHEDGVEVTDKQIAAVANWQAKASGKSWCDYAFHMAMLEWPAGRADEMSFF